MGESADARIVVKERSGVDFAAELWWDNDSKGVAVAGKVSDNGTVLFKVTKEIKGTVLKDLVANGRFRGTLSGKNLTGQVAVPGKNARFGELRLKLKA